MRRGLVFVSLTLVLLGLELSTEALTLVARRLGAGAAAMAAGAQFHVPAFRFVVGVAGLALGLVLSGLLLWSSQRRDAVTAVGDLCPRCGNETRRVRRREWQRLLGVLLAERTTRRRCQTCGWLGLSLKN